MSTGLHPTSVQQLTQSVHQFWQQKFARGRELIFSISSGYAVGREHAHLTLSQRDHPVPPESGAGIYVYAIRWSIVGASQVAPLNHKLNSKRSVYAHLLARPG